MRRAWIVLLAVPAFAAPAASQGTPPPGGAPAIRVAIRTAEMRLQALVALSRADPRMDDVRRYLAYTAEQLRDPRKAVTVEILYAIVTDGKASEEARVAAANALDGDAARLNDPDLSTEGRGVHRPRAAFSLKVVASLTDEDVLTRGLSERILETLWTAVEDPAIRLWNARVEKTWRPAKKAWQDHLRK